MIDEAVLVCDVDGVLVSARYLASQPREADLRSPEDDRWCERLDPEAVARLSRLAEASGALLVMSSEWRRTMSMGTLARHLRRRGYTGRRFDRTPSLGDRCEEIRAWLDANPRVTRFAVLDDDRRAWGPDRLVLTSWADGLTEADVERAMAILGRA